MSRSIPVVVAPLDEEVAPFVSRIGGQAEHRVDDLTTYRGEIAGRPVLAAVIGDGAGAAERGLARLLARVEPQRLLLIGVAGGLSEELTAGSLIQASSVRSVDGEDQSVTAGTSIEGVVRGSVVTAERIVSTADAKRDLWVALGRPPCCVVDIESWGVVERLEHLGVPWTVVRAVIDAADEDLPLDFGALSDAEGQVVRRRILWSLLRRPVAMKGVLELRSRVRVCASELAVVAERWLLA